jgi:hypothetical protein
MKIKLEAASAKQLADFSVARLGLDVNFRMGADRIRALMVTAGFDQDAIEVDEQPAVPAAQPAASAVHVNPDPNGDRLVTIVIQQEPGSAGKEHVKVAVNGKAMLIPRAKPVQIPYRFYEALKHANRMTYDPAEDGVGLQPGRETPAYPFQVIAGA